MRPIVCLFIVINKTLQPTYYYKRIVNNYDKNYEKNVLCNNRKSFKKLFVDIVEIYHNYI